MLILTIAQLEKQGITSQELENSHQIKCVNKIMERVADFPNQKHYQACELGKSYLNLGIFSFVSESKTGFTVWKEKQAVDKQKIAREIQTKMNQARVNTVANIFNHQKEQNLIKAKHQRQQRYDEIIPKTEQLSIQKRRLVSTEKLPSISQLTSVQIDNDHQQQALSDDIYEPQVNLQDNCLPTGNNQQLEPNQHNQEIVLLNSSQNQEQKRKYRGISY